MSGRPPDPTYEARLEPVKEFIRQHWIREHYAPSLRDVALEFNISFSVARYQLQALERFGWLEPRKKGAAHNIVPVEIFKDRPVFLCL